MTEVVYRGLGFALIMVTLFATGTWTARTRWWDAEWPWSTRLEALGSLLLVAAWYARERDRRFQARLTGQRWLLPPLVIVGAWIAATLVVDLVVGLAGIALVEPRVCTGGPHVCDHGGLVFLTVLVTLTAVGLVGATVHTAAQTWRRYRQSHRQVGRSQL